jgi:hypothetical protein
MNGRTLCCVLTVLIISMVTQAAQAQWDVGNASHGAREYSMGWLNTTYFEVEAPLLQFWTTEVWVYPPLPFNPVLVHVKTGWGDWTGTKQSWDSYIPAPANYNKYHDTQLILRDSTGEIMDTHWVYDDFVPHPLF